MAQSSIDLRTLRLLIDEHFNTAELKQLYFDLGIDWGDLDGGTDPEKIQSLIQYMQRRGRLPDLLAILRKERPDVEWPPDPPEDEPGRAGSPCRH